jgi:hypothetical protein
MTDNAEIDLVALAERERALAQLDGEDATVARLWHDGNTLIDGRYSAKGLLAVVDLAMRDPQFRSLLVDNPAEVLPGVRAGLELPDVELVFHENTAETLHVVLPPAAGDRTFRSDEASLVLNSRTADAMLETMEARAGGGGPNWYNHGDVFADAIFGPPRDHGDR